MKDKWQMAFIGLLVSLFLGWAGWVSLTLIERSEIIAVSEMRLQKLEQMTLILFKKMDAVEDKIKE